MRTIKFRGKCTDDGMWRYGDLLHENGLLWINDNGLHCTVDENTVGQFTGIKDKKGKEIYEGDIVSVNDFTSVYTTPYKGVVSVYRSSWVVEHESSFGIMRPLLHFDDFPQYKNLVIGNIHDNPNLK